jgi:uncharacterized protein YidB (DUF937 family)
MGVLDQILGGVLGQVLGGAQGGAYGGAQGGSRAALIQAVLAMLLQGGLGRGGHAGGGGLADVLGGLLGGGQPGADPRLGGALRGGLGGMADMFRQAGMQRQVDSWIAQGPNLAVSPNEITAALGESQLSQLAEQSGMSRSDVSRELADILPGMVDRMTPGGEMPRQDLGADELGTWMSDVLNGRR